MNETNILHSINCNTVGADRGNCHSFPVNIQSFNHSTLLLDHRLGSRETSKEIITVRLYIVCAYGGATATPDLEITTKPSVTK